VVSRCFHCSKHCSNTSSGMLFGVAVACRKYLKMCGPKSDLQFGNRQNSQVPNLANIVHDQIFLSNFWAKKLTDSEHVMNRVTFVTQEPNTGPRSRPSPTSNPYIHCHCVPVTMQVSCATFSKNIKASGVLVVNKNKSTLSSVWLATKIQFKEGGGGRKVNLSLCLSTTTLNRDCSCSTTHS
jgi:hypothetical protein